MDKYNVERNGFKYLFGCTEESVIYALNYMPSNDDLFVVSYPKCGTTWTQHIIHGILSGGAQEVDIKGFPTSTWIECFGSHTIRKPFIKSHLPYHLVPMNASAKYVFVLRNPKDTVVSYHYHRVGKPWYESMDFHQFFHEWVSGRAYGDYFAHVADYWRHRFDGNFLHMFYEQMKRNPKEAVLKIADFLGKEYVESLCENNEEILNRVLKYSTIDTMKIKGREKTKNTRKGIVGDWRSHLTRDESDLIDEKVEEYFAGTELMDIWREDMEWHSK